MLCLQMNISIFILIHLRLSSLLIKGSYGDVHSFSFIKGKGVRQERTFSKISTRKNKGYYSWTPLVGKGKGKETRNLCQMYYNNKNNYIRKKSYHMG